MLNRISIRTRQITTVILLIMGFVLVGMFAYDNLEGIHDNLERVTAYRDQRDAIAAIGAKLETLNLQLEQLRFDSPTISQSEMSIEETLRGIRAEFDALARLDPQLRGWQTMQAAFLHIEQQVLALLAKGPERAGTADALLEQVLGLSNAMRLLDSNIQAQIGTELDDISQQSAQVLLRVVVVLTGLGIIVIAMTVINTLAISSGIHALTEGAKKLMVGGGGEIIRFPRQRADEFAQLGEDFNLMATAIRSQRFAIQAKMRELEAARAQAILATERKSVYLANMSHELRAPMHIILNFARLLATGELGKLNAQQQECLQHLLASGQHLMAVINDLLDMARIEAGQLELHPKVLDLAALLKEAEADAHALIAQYQKDISFHIADLTYLPLVYADPVRVKQVLLNLISNAVRFTDHGGITVNFTNGAGMLTICVEDTGIGISLEKQAAIFERFEQVDSAKNSREGTGLGLAIARELVQLQGGQLWLTSTPGQGSQFRFSLPLAQPEKTSA